MVSCEKRWPRGGLERVRTKHHGNDNFTLSQKAPGSATGGLPDMLTQAQDYSVSNRTLQLVLRVSD